MVTFVFMAANKQKKLLISTIFVFSLLVLGLSNTTQALAASATLTLTPATVTTSVGQTVSVKIDLNTGGSTTDGTRAILLFDKNLLEATAVVPGSLYKEYPQTAQTVDNTTGTVKVSGIAPDAPYNGTGTFATIDFKAKSAGSTTIRFDFTQGSTTDSNVADTATSSDILAQATGATVTISGSGTGGTSGNGGTTSDQPSATMLPNTASLDPTVMLGAMGGLFIMLGIGLLFAL